jgi:4-amino-4-deoxy-L-arabinose transferase-like glycosyltransferase
MFLNRLAALRGGALLWLLAYGTVWVVLPVVFNAGLPSDTVEIVAWGREWLVGLYRHPPMKTWLMEIAFQAGGWGGSGYVLSAAAFAVAQLCLYAAIRDVRSRAFAFAAVAMGGLVYHLGLQLPQWNADIAQLPFAGLFVLGLWRALDRGGLHWWLLAGMAAAGGFLSKYTFALLPVTLAALAIADPWMRARIRLLPAAAGVITTAALVAPNLWWFFTHPEMVAEGVAYNERLVPGDAIDHLLSPLNVIGATIGVAVLPGIAAHFGLVGKGAPVGEDVRLKKLRSILAAAFFAPVAFYVVATAATGFGFKDHWLIVFYFFLPSWLLLARWGSHDAVAWTARGATFVLVTLAVLAALFSVGRVGPYWMANGKPVSRGVLMPPAPLAEAATETWRQALAVSGLPADMQISIVGGEHMAAALSAELPQRPAWYEALNRLRSPWVTPDMLRRQGILVVQNHDARQLLDLGLCRAAMRDFDWLNARGTMGVTVVIEAWVPAPDCPGR